MPAGGDRPARDLARGQPHLHSQALVVNATLAATGKWRTLYSLPLYLNAKPAGIHYQQTLAGYVNELGYGVAWNNNGTSSSTVFPVT